jgi:hypothetical protein
MGESMGMHAVGMGEGPPIATLPLTCGVRHYAETCYGQNLLAFHQLVGPLSFEQQIRWLHAEADNSNFAPVGQATARRYSYLDDSARRFLRVHENPARAQRVSGVGGDRPVRAPKDSTSEGAGCFICPTTIAYKSGYRQLYIVHTVNGNELRFLVNPYRLFEGHMTAASVAHEPQSWGPRGAATTPQRIERTVMDVYGVASDLPDALVMFNGDGAGATISEHYHLHVMPHWNEALFPLQVAALEAARSGAYRLIADPSSGSIVELVDDGELYPLAFARAVGLAGARALVGLLQRWVDLSSEATANLIAVREQGEIAMYLVPRDRRFNRAPGLQGVPGALEMLGEIVLTTPAEAERIARNEFSYGVLWRMLRSVRPTDVGMLVAE